MTEDVEKEKRMRETKEHQELDNLVYQSRKNKEQKKFDKAHEAIEKKFPGVLDTPTEVAEFQTLRASGFPVKLFDEWKQDVKARFSDIHWAKIWSDHLKAQSYDLVVGSAVERASETPEEETEEEKETEIPLIG